ncbi:hint-domain-domain-containing protein [Coniella lustricola]|uniref:Hint-domain-domain-containing protein n=1 Tax=Coniella lustricola TaxID=2025994 RepID=A0A2T3AI85_9PEZI|nr:hint-domain-domain-containing protein [Coniella lustricola]
MIFKCLKNNLSFRSARCVDAQQSPSAREGAGLISVSPDAYVNSPPAAPPPYSEKDADKREVESTSFSISIHPLPPGDGVILKVEPPRTPQDAGLTHVPCDIALVIDVSRSMSEEAPIPGKSRERTGLSVLDLVKHSCQTIIHTLNESDRLAIITFSRWATTLQPLTPMTPPNKLTTVACVNKIEPESCTNLWHGLRNGIRVFQNDPELKRGQHNKARRVPAIMVLTDGAPNHMCPGQGYVAALRSLMGLADDSESADSDPWPSPVLPSIHTFGFGYHLESGLLKSIAEVGRGIYAFIPDAGMVGTVFIHAVANLQSTCAIQASLRLEYPESIELEQTAGEFVGRQEPLRAPGQETMSLTISLGTFRYGQSRDVYLRWKTRDEDTEKDSAPILRARLDYVPTTLKEKHMITTSQCLLDHTTTISAAEIAYHISRHDLCAFIASIFPMDLLGEHHPMTILMRKDHENDSKTSHEEMTSPSSILCSLRNTLHALTAQTPAAQFPNDPQCASIMHDLAGRAHGGQIPQTSQMALALADTHSFLRWGRHYLLSLHGAHAEQLCNSFKDPGPLQYSANSPLFARCRERLNRAFDDLPPPRPSRGEAHVGIPLSLPATSSARRGRSVYNSIQRPDLRGMDVPDRTAMTGRDYMSLTMSMAAYNSPDNPCFAGNNDNDAMKKIHTMPLSRLEKGMHVVTPLGPRRVAAVLATPVRDALLVEVEGILVTPWHPIAATGVTAREWVFPWEVAAVASAIAAKKSSKNKGRHVAFKHTGTVYSVLLEPDENVDAHAILLQSARRSNGTSSDSHHTSTYIDPREHNFEPIWGITLGHGLLTGEDVRAHSFFGDYEQVVSSLSEVGVDGAGRFVGGGVERSGHLSLVCGFRGYRSVKSGLSNAEI